MLVIPKFKGGFMKVTINIECSPAEARAFMGLPDLATMQENMLNTAQTKMNEAMGGMAPEDMMKLWFPASAKSFGDLQNMMWDHMTNMANTMGGTGGSKSATANKTSGKKAR